MEISGIYDKADLAEGQWVGGIPGLPGVELQVRSANYRPYVRARDRALREAAPDMAQDGGEDAFWAITGRAMAEHLLTGWRGLKVQGEAAGFDTGLAVQLLTADDPHGIGERFRRGVDWASSKVAADLIAKTERLAGNSPPPSAGQSSTARRSRQ